MVQAKGMSYGKYVAMQRMEKERKKKIKATVKKDLL